MSHEDQMSELNVWGCTGNLAHTQHLIEKGGVLEMFCRINLDYLKGYTVTGVTHGHDGHIQPREWVLGLSGMSLRYLLERPPGGRVLSVRGYGARSRTGRHASGLRSGCGGAARGRGG